MRGSLSKSSKPSGFCSVSLSELMLNGLWAPGENLLPPQVPTVMPHRCFSPVVVAPCCCFLGRLNAWHYTKLCLNLCCLLPGSCLHLDIRKYGTPRMERASHPLLQAPWVYGEKVVYSNCSGVCQSISILLEEGIISVLPVHINTFCFSQNIVLCLNHSPMLHRLPSCMGSSVLSSLFLSSRETVCTTERFGAWRDPALLWAHAQDSGM